MKHALILTENQTHFLAEKRQDPITQDEFSIGNEIVFCASCKSAFLKESWEFMGEKHCNQYKTLNNFPISERLLLGKNKLTSNYIKAEITSRIVATFIDAFIAGIISLLLMGVFSSILNSESNFIALYIGLVLFIFRDTFFLNQSIGKRMMKLYFIDSKTKQNAIWYRVFARNLIWWIISGLVASTFNVFSFLFLLAINVGYIFYMIAKGQSFLDKLLQIELVEEKEIEEIISDEN